MVRLEDHMLQVCKKRLNYFNSTMVRLEAPDDLRLLLLHLFQFHYGTIRSPRPPKSPSEKRYFNSTMVRLEG